MDGRAPTFEASRRQQHHDMMNQHPQLLAAPSALQQGHAAEMLHLQHISQPHRQLSSLANSLLSAGGDSDDDGEEGRSAGSVLGAQQQHPQSLETLLQEQATPSPPPTAEHLYGDSNERQMQVGMLT